MRCQAAKVWLGSLHLPFDVIDIYQEPEHIALLRDQKMETLPVFRIGETWIQGFDRMKLLATIAAQMESNR